MKRVALGFSADADGLLGWMRENNGYITHSQVSVSGWDHDDARALVQRGDARRVKARHRHDSRTFLLYAVTDMERVVPRSAALDRIGTPVLVARTSGAE